MPSDGSEGPTVKRTKVESTLLKASKSGDLKAVKRLFRKQDPSSFSAFILHAVVLAARSNHLQIVKLLCKHTDCTSDNYIAARLAVKAKSEFLIVHELLKPHNSADDDGMRLITSHLVFAISLCMEKGFVDVFKYIAPHYMPPRVMEAGGVNLAKRFFKKLALDALRSDHAHIFLPEILKENGPFVARISTEDKLRVYEKLITEAQNSGKISARNYILTKALSIHDLAQPEDISQSRYPKLLTAINFARSLDTFSTLNYDVKRLMRDNLLEELFSVDE